MSDKNVPASEIAAPTPKKAPGEADAPAVPVDKTENPQMAMVGTGQRDRTSAPVGSSNAMADKPAAPSFLDDFFNQLGLSTKPVMVLGIVGLTFMFFWKAA